MPSRHRNAMPRTHVRTTGHSRDNGTWVEKALEKVSFLETGGDVKRRLSVGVGDVGIGAVLEENREHGDTA